MHKQWAAAARDGIGGDLYIFRIIIVAPLNSFLCSASKKVDFLYLSG